MEKIEFLILKELFELFKQEEGKNLEQRLETALNVFKTAPTTYASIIGLIQTEVTSNSPLTDLKLEAIVTTLEQERMNDVRPKILSFLLDRLQNEKPWVFDEMVRNMCKLILQNPYFIFILPIIQNVTHRRELIDHFPPERIHCPLIRSFLLQMVHDPDSWIRGRVIDLLEQVIDHPAVRRTFLQIRTEEKDLWIKNRIIDVLGKEAV